MDRAPGRGESPRRNNPAGVATTRAVADVLVVDDHWAVREGLRQRFVAKGFRVRVAATGAEAISAAESYRPDLVLLDVRLPDSPGPAVCAAIQERAPDSVVVILSAFADAASVRAAFDAGARAYMLKDADDVSLFDAIDRAVQGESVVDPRAAGALLASLDARRVTAVLTEQELKVVQLAAQGLTNREIAARIYLSRHTVKEYLSAAMRKLGVASRVELATKAVQLGLLDPQ